MLNFDKKYYVSLNRQKLSQDFYKNSIKSVAYKLISYRFYYHFS